MDLEELKNTWMVMDEQIKKNKILEETIIKKMIESKTTKSLSNLLNYEIFATILLFLVIPIIFYMINRLSNFRETNIIYRYIFIVTLVICILGCFYQFWKVYSLMKINLSNSIKSNITLIQRYSIQIHWEKFSNYIALFLVIIILTVIYFAEQNYIEPWRWIAVLCIVLVSAFICVVIYKWVYDTNIQAIKKCLEELKELKEE